MAMTIVMTPDRGPFSREHTSSTRRGARSRKGFYPFCELHESFRTDRGQLQSKAASISRRTLVKPNRDLQQVYPTPQS